MGRSELHVPPLHRQGGKDSFKELGRMTLNLTAYGMGLGLVMVGWVAGMVIGYVFSMIRNLRFLV